MPNVAQHANQVSCTQFGSLSEDTRARKMADNTPVAFLPVLVAAALITAVGSI